MNKIFFFLLAASAIYAQESPMLVTPNAGTPRAMGAGNCYSVHATGADGLFGNPAQLNLNSNTEFYISGAFRPWSQVQASGSYIEDNYSQYELDVEPQFDLPHFSISVPFEYAYRKQMTFGVGFRTLYDAANTWSADANFINDDGMMQWTEETSGLVREVTASAGVSLGNHYNLGITVGIPVYSDLEISTVSSLESMNSSLRKTSLNSDYDISADMSLQLGFLYYTENFKLGLTVFKKNQLAITQIRHTLADGSNSTESKQYYQYPHLFTAGLAYRPLKKLWLYSQIGNRSWNKIMYSGEYLTELPSGYAAHAGFEYGDFLQIRGGYSRDVRALYEATDKQSLQQNIHAGAGINWENSTIDIAVRYSFYDYSESIFNARSQTDYQFQNLSISIAFQQKLQFQLSR